MGKKTQALLGAAAFALIFSAASCTQLAHRSTNSLNIFRHDTMHWTLVQKPAVMPPVFKTARAAHRHCPADSVVWYVPTLRKWFSHIDRRYGQIKTGAYACKKEIVKAGGRQAHLHAILTTFVSRR